MSERLFEMQQAAENEGRPSEAKVWGVILSQIWAGLSGYRFATADLPEVRSSSIFTVSRAEQPRR
jgi:ribosomal RNA-processing protein 12